MPASAVPEMIKEATNRGAHGSGIPTLQTQFRSTTGTIISSGCGSSFDAIEERPRAVADIREPVARCDIEA